MKMGIINSTINAYSRALKLNDAFGHWIRIKEIYTNYEAKNVIAAEYYSRIDTIIKF